MNQSIKIIAVIVTYNRKELLMECLDAVIGQSYGVSKIVLVDNCSTDGTEEALRENKYLDNSIIQYIRLKENTGGAGGFFEGMKRAKDMEYDWIWVMDDDTIPNSNCLEKLLEANNIVSQNDKENKVSFLASTVYGTNGEFMNLPKISTKKSENGYAYWYKFLDKGIVGISMATFVSILIKKDAIERCGLPCKDFFIWGDDSEYTTRLTTYYGDAYFVGNSVAIHKRNVAKPIQIKNEKDTQRASLFHYKYRNTDIINRYYDPNYNSLTQFALAMLCALKCITKPNGMQEAKARFRGYWESAMQYKIFKKYIDGQLSS